MNPNQKLDPNTILHHVCCKQTRYDVDNNIIIDSYSLIFQYYDNYYQIEVTKEAIETNRKEMAICGKVALMDIFEKKCKGKFWSIIKAKCKAYDKWYLKNEVNYEGEFNPKKQLVPLGESGQVFQNLRPRIIKTPFRKGVLEFGDFFYIEDLPLMRIGGSIFWYAIGDNQFDIREMRKAAKFRKEVYAADTKPNTITSLGFIAYQLETIAQQQDLSTFINRLLTPIASVVSNYSIMFSTKENLLI